MQASPPPWAVLNVSAMHPSTVYKSLPEAEQLGVGGGVWGSLEEESSWGEGYHNGPELIVKTDRVRRTFLCSPQSLVEDGHNRGLLCCLGRRSRMNPAH